MAPHDSFNSRVSHLGKELIAVCQMARGNLSQQEALTDRINALEDTSADTAKLKEKRSRLQEEHNMLYYKRLYLSEELDAYVRCEKLGIYL